MNTHSFVDDGDGWCVDCQLPKANQRHSPAADAAPLPSATRNYAHLSPHATEKSNEAGLRAYPRSGGIKARLLDTLIEVDSHRGMTDDELHKALPAIGQNSLRPRRIDLVSDGWLEQARNETGNPVNRNGFTAWRLTEAGRMQWRKQRAA